MSNHARIYPWYSGIFTTIKYILFGFGGGLDINFNEFRHKSLILFIDPRVFLELASTLFYIFNLFFYKKIKGKNADYLLISLFTGIFFNI